MITQESKCGTGIKYKRQMESIRYDNDRRLCEEGQSNILGKLINADDR